MRLGANHDHHGLRQPRCNSTAGGGAPSAQTANHVRAPATLNHNGSEWVECDPNKIRLRYGGMGMAVYSEIRRHAPGL